MSMVNQQPSARFRLYLSSVAWAERSETRVDIVLQSLGFAPLNPGYDEILTEIRWVSVFQHNPNTDRIGQRIDAEMSVIHTVSSSSATRSLLSMNSSCG